MGLKDKIKQNLGTSLPAMISRQGNVFTLRDGAGNERSPAPQLDIVIVDGNGHVSKQYRAAVNFDPNDPTPPDCFSDNGEAPSEMALSPQSARCIDCKWNARNSAVSKISGKGIKACSDNQKLAVLVVGDAQPILYQLMITPGNLAAFRQYIRTLEGHKYEPEEVVTRISFVPKSTGLLQFEPIDTADAELKQIAASIAGTRACQFVTGEDDRPVQLQLQLAAPAAQREIEPEAQADTPGPTREQLEARLAEMRGADAKPVRKAAPLKTVQGEMQEIPAFLSKGKPPSTSNFGLVSKAPPPPAEVTAMLDQQGTQVSPMEGAIKKAFALPVRS